MEHLEEKVVNEKLSEISDEIRTLQDLFSRRLMEDKQKKQLIQVLTDEAEYAFMKPFLYEIILLLDRLEQVEDDFSCRRLTPPVVELFLLLFPTKHLIPPRVRLYHFKYKFWPGLGQGENSIFPRQEIVKPGRPAKTWTIFGMGEFAFRAGFEAVRFKPEGYSGS